MVVMVGGVVAVAVDIRIRIRITARGSVATRITARNSVTATCRGSNSITARNSVTASIATFTVSNSAVTSRNNVAAGTDTAGSRSSDIVIFEKAHVQKGGMAIAKNKSQNKIINDVSQAFLGTSDGVLLDGKQKRQHDKIIGIWDQIQFMFNWIFELNSIRV